MFEDDLEPIHGYFGLTYASYLVFPRLILQSMPLEWQRRFVALLEEIPKVIAEDFEPEGGYRVQSLDINGKFVRNKYNDYRHGDQPKLHTRKAGDVK